ncbi:apolipoprotein C-I [Xiphias gladius]|uniref:apolipoprotein C-I n=1 Tax=Xiphias gladius TaxID=8245 RepID=UPI001A980809|nr:apolipoprotein C-I [Xiphias gladius]
MRLYLAAAVLMLALVAYAEAEGETAAEQLSRLGERVSEMSRNLAEKAKTTFEELHNSEFATTSRNWFRDTFENLKTRLGGVSQ